MATVTLTIEDTADGGARLTGEADPPMDAEKGLSAAQAIALRLFVAAGSGPGEAKLRILPPAGTCAVPAPA